MIKDISILSLSLTFLLLLPPLGIMLYFKIKLIRSTFIAVLRMTLQLFAMGIFLEYIFTWNNTLLNISWLIVMIVVASFNVVRRSELRLRFLYFFVFFSFIISNLLVLLYFNYFVLNLDDIFDARYLIAIAGMLLGNSLRGNIIGISHFFETIKKDENRYLYKLSMGAGKYEILREYVSDSISLALKPAVASIAVTGLVSLPGMMTGQILGGSSPIIAIKYQLSIMVAILSSTSISVMLSILFSLSRAIDPYGMIRSDIFKDSSK